MKVIPEFVTFRVTSHVALRDAIGMIFQIKLTAEEDAALRSRPRRSKNSST